MSRLSARTQTGGCTGVSGVLRRGLFSSQSNNAASSKGNYEVSDEIMEKLS